MCVVVHRWTGSRLAGLVSGSLVAFNAFTLTRFPQIQDLHLEFLPLAVWALDRLIRVPTVGHALSLAGWFVMQALTSGYWLLFSTVALVVGAAARAGEWTARGRRPFVPLAALAGVVAGVAILPFPAAVLEGQSRARSDTKHGGGESLLGSHQQLPGHGRQSALQLLEPTVLRQRGRLALPGCDRAEPDRRGHRVRCRVSRRPSADGAGVRGGRLRALVRTGASRLRGALRGPSLDDRGSVARRGSDNSGWSVSRCSPGSGGREYGTGSSALRGPPPGGLSCHWV